MEAAWYPDPFGRHEHRYWDGTAWTAHVSNGGVAATDDPIPANAPPAATPGGGEDPVIAGYREADARGDAEGAVLLGEALAKLGQIDAARAALERGEARGHPEAAACLGNLLSDIGDRAGARQAYERGIAAGSTMAALNLGLMLAQAGEVEDALAYLRVAQAQGDPEAHWAVGKLLEDGGDTAGAIEAYGTGAAAGFAPAATGLANLLYRSGDEAGAMSAWRRAADLGDDRAREILAMIAREQEQQPGDPRAGQQLAQQLAAACGEVMRVHDLCATTAEQVQKARYVAGQPQAPASRATFEKRAQELEHALGAQLGELVVVQATAQGLWHQLESGYAAPGERMHGVLTSFLTQGLVDADAVATIMVGGTFAATSFGTELDSFLAADARLAAAFEAQDG